MPSPSEVTCVVLGSSTIRTFAPSVGPNTRASGSGVSESRSPPTISSGIDAGSGFGVAGTAGSTLRGRGQSMQPMYGWV